MCQRIYNLKLCCYTNKKPEKRVYQDKKVPCANPGLPQCTETNKFGGRFEHTVCADCTNKKLAPKGSLNPAANQGTEHSMSSGDWRPSNFPERPAPKAPSREMSNSPLAFTDRSRPATPAQHGVIYDDQEKPLPANTVPLTGPQTAAEKKLEWKEEIRRNVPSTSSDQLSGIWRNIKGDDVYKKVSTNQR